VDPAVAALAGAFLGMAGSLVVPILSSRRAHKARRRDLMREVYAEGMRVIAEMIRSHDLEGYSRLNERLFEAQVQIRLLGSKATSRKFDRVANALLPFVHVAMDEMSKPEDEIDLDKRMEEEFPDWEESSDYELTQVFISAARRDMGMEDSLPIRAWDFTRIKFGHRGGK
jgi:hypothetical protein